MVIIPNHINEIQIILLLILKLGEEGENILRAGEQVITFFSSTSKEPNVIAEIPRGSNMLYNSLFPGLSLMSLVF